MLAGLCRFRGRTVSPEFVRLLIEGNWSDEDVNSPRNVMNAFFYKPTLRPPGDREEVLFPAVLSARVGDDDYPGDSVLSQNWPQVAPGARGMNSAISPKYCDLSAFAATYAGPEALWVRGTDDQVIFDSSFGYLGQFGAVPGWPGAGVYPPQPMVAQLKSVLAGCREELIPGCGHSPRFEKLEALM